MPSVYFRGIQVPEGLQGRVRLEIRDTSLGRPTFFPAVKHAFEPPNTILDTNGATFFCDTATR